MFYDYLLANLKLYFDRFEKELSADVQEPESDEYNQAKQANDIPDEPEDDLNLGIWSFLLDKIENQIYANSCASKW